MQSQFCSSCGAPLNGATLFCPHCDAPLRLRREVAVEEPATPVFPPATSVGNAIEIESVAYQRANRGVLYFQATGILGATFYNIGLALGMLPGNDLVRIILTFIEFMLSVAVIGGWYVETSARHLPALWFQRKAWLNLLVYWLLMTALMNGPVYLASRQLYPEVIALTAAVCLIGVFFEVFPHRKNLALEQRILDHARERAALLLDKPRKNPLRQRILAFCKFVILDAFAYLTVLPTLMFVEGGDLNKTVFLGPVTALLYVLLTLWYLEQGGNYAFESAVRSRSRWWPFGFWMSIWALVAVCTLPIAGVSIAGILAIGASSLALTLLFSAVAWVSLRRQGT